MSKKISKKYKVIVTFTNGKRLESTFASHSEAYKACSALWARRTDITIINIKKEGDII